MPWRPAPWAYERAARVDRITASDLGGGMATCDWMVLCNYAFDDSEQRVCLVGVLGYNTPVSNLPGLFPDIFLVFEVTTPSGELIAHYEPRGQIGVKGSQPVRIHIRDMTLSEPGVYQFLLSVNGSLLTSTHLNIASVTLDETKH